MPATTTGSPFSLSVPSVSTDLADLFGTYLKPNMATINTYAAHKGTAQTFSALQTFSAGITVSASGASITGNSSITGTLTGLTGLTVASGGATITGNSSITGTLTGLTGLTVASGGATITSGNLTLNGASPLIDFSGSTSQPSIKVQATNGLSVLNAAASSTLMSLTNAGVMTVAAGLTVTTGGISVTGNSTINGTLGSVSTITASSTISGTAHISTGLTGATTQARYVGGVTGSSAPASGTFALNDVVVGTGGVIFVCTAAGTPGTWATVGAGTATVTFRQSFLLSGM